ncbi:hypothetical protein ACFE04_026133 [Oxalis oulophora]
MDDVHQRRSARELFKHIQLGIDHPLLRHQPMDMDGLETKEVTIRKTLKLFYHSRIITEHYVVFGSVVRGEFTRFGDFHQELASGYPKTLLPRLQYFTLMVTETPELSSVKVVEHGHVKVLDWPEKLAVLVSFAKTMQFLHTRVIPDFFNNRLSDYYIPVYYLAENLNEEANGEGPKSW